MGTILTVSTTGFKMGSLDAYGELAEAKDNLKGTVNVADFNDEAKLD